MRNGDDYLICRRLIYGKTVGSLPAIWYAPWRAHHDSSDSGRRGCDRSSGQLCSSLVRATRLFCVVNIYRLCVYHGSTFRLTYFSRKMTWTLYIYRGSKTLLSSTRGVRQVIALFYVNYFHRPITRLMSYYNKY